MDETSILVVDTAVRRQEDGLVLTFTYEDGNVEEFHMSPGEARYILYQLDSQLSLASGEKP